MTDPTDSINIEQYVKEQVPAAMQDLNKTEEKIPNIIKWVSYNYEHKDKEQTFSKTQEYTTNVFLNVAYRIQKAGNDIITLLKAETEEIERLGLEMDYLLNCVSQNRDSSIRTSLEQLSQEKETRKSQKFRQIPHNEMTPGITTPVTHNERGNINFAALDDIGTTLQRESANSRTRRQPSTISSSPAPSTPPPPAPEMNAPPDSGAPPPPPPPSSSPPPPPPSSSTPPPPPPPSSSGGAPPPPPPAPAPAPAASKPPPSSAGRGDLLSAIRNPDNMKKLKKTDTDDKSGPKV
eukprot:gb/GECH01013878.1/.p1 GENE.gb/GECH01013878.1/~~gb/GECH01013878.1/.p1  ORF type:complete len:292 (+),score=112.56 gb/GECH01013878.1/:1-876(+)